METTNQSAQALPHNGPVHLFYTNKSFFWRNSIILLLMVFYCAISLIFKIDTLFTNMLASTALILGCCYSIYNIMSCRNPYVVYGEDFIQVLSRKVNFDQITFLDNQASTHFIVHYKLPQAQVTAKHQDGKLYIFWRRLTPNGQTELRLLLEKLIRERSQNTHS